MTRGECTNPEGNAIRLAVDDAHAPVIDAERIGADLRHHGLDALPNRRRPGNHLHGPGLVNAEVNALGRPKTALFHEHREPGADCFAGGAAAPQVRLQAVPADGGERLVEQARIVA